MNAWVHRGFLIGSFWPVLAGISGCTDQTVPADWKTDCVGRMQISLPGEVDIAAMLPKDWIRKWSGENDSSYSDSSYKFPDGQEASRSQTAFMRITHPMTADEKAVVDKTIARRWSGAQEYARGKAKKTGEIYDLTQLPKSEYVKLAWRSTDYFKAYFDVGGTIVEWDGDMPSAARDYQFLLTGLRPRPTFDVPKELGVCLPYLFVKDDGSSTRHISMSYRLRAHPDITVSLEDTSAATIDKDRNPFEYTAEFKTGSFWGKRYRYSQDVQSLWPFHLAFKDTTLAGRRGVKTFVEFIGDIKEQNKNFGYVVAVRGDPRAEEDRPDLMLYVIQDTLNATRWGIAPLSKQEFLAIAESVAASLKPRVTRMP